MKTQCLCFTSVWLKKWIFLLFGDFNNFGTCLQLNKVKLIIKPNIMMKKKKKVPLPIVSFWG